MYHLATLVLRKTDTRKNRELHFLKNDWIRHNYHFKTVDGRDNDFFSRVLPIFLIGKICRAIRVNRLGDFSPNGRLFTMGSFWKIQN
jgi:hypothetical protein